jgi:hypothetical protein
MVEGMKVYIVRVEFFSEPGDFLEEADGSGCDQVVQVVADAFASKDLVIGKDVKVRLTAFLDKIDVR